MPAFPAPEVAILLREFGQRTALRGGNPYRAKAYTRAAENLMALAEPLEDVVAEERLKEIPGVGDAIGDIIAKLHKTGKHPSLEAMRKEIPAGALEMLAVPGLRPDKVLKIYKELGISSLDALEQAAKEDRLKPVKGLGAALQAKILQGIEIRRKGEGQRHLHRAAMLLDTAARQLRRSSWTSRRSCLPATFAVAASSWPTSRRWSRPARSKASRESLLPTPSSTCGSPTSGGWVPLSCGRQA